MDGQLYGGHCLPACQPLLVTAQWAVRYSSGADTRTGARGPYCCCTPLIDLMNSSDKGFWFDWVGSALLHRGLYKTTMYSLPSTRSKAHRPARVYTEPWHISLCGAGSVIGLRAVAVYYTWKKRAKKATKKGEKSQKWWWNLMRGTQSGGISRRRNI